MKFQKLFIKLPANSLLESVIALSVISICLYITVLVYATVYKSNTSQKFYYMRNKEQTIFFMSQIFPDSTFSEFQDVNIIEREYLSADLEQIFISTKDSLKFNHIRRYYILNK